MFPAQIVNVPAVDNNRIVELIKKVEEQKSAWDKCSTLMRENDLFEKLSHALIKTDVPHANLMKFYNASDKMNAVINAKAWEELVSIIHLEDLLSSGQWSQWLDLVHNLETPEFNEENVFSQIKQWHDEAGLLFSAQVNELWDALSRKYKTNKAQGFPSTIIVPDMFVRPIDGSPVMAHVLNKMFKLLSNMTSSPKPDLIENKFYWIKQKNLFGKWYEFNRFAYMKLFKNGNLHIAFTQEALDLLNKALAFANPNILSDGVKTLASKTQKINVHGILLDKKAVEFLHHLLVRLHIESPLDYSIKDPQVTHLIQHLNINVNDDNCLSLDIRNKINMILESGLLP